MMNLDLFVDTSRKGISMALHCAEKSIYEETVDGAARGETASAIMDELLNRVGATLDDVKRVMVTVGPGSFSGLRTGVAFCQGLCFSGKRELYGVSTLQALACFGSANDKDAAVVIRARSGYWYLRLNEAESFIPTEEVIAQLKTASPKAIVLDDAALADEALSETVKSLEAAGTVIANEKAQPLSAWSPLFDKVKASLIQEANYIQPSYFEKLH